MEIHKILTIAGVIFPLLALGDSDSTNHANKSRGVSLGDQLEVLQESQSLMPAENEQSFAEPTGEITLLDAFSAALLNNPKLAQYSWSVRMSEADALQAGFLPNPELEFEIEEFAGSGPTSGFDGAESSILISQLIELGQKRQNRTQVAQSQKEAAQYEYEAIRVSILAEVSKAFVSVLATQQHVEMMQMNMELANQAFSAAEKRVQAGAASPLEEAKAAAIVSSGKIDLERAQRNLESVRIELAAMWGSKSPAFEQVKGEFLIHEGLPNIQYLYDELNKHPEILRWAKEVTEHKERITLEQSKATSDIKLGAGLKHLNESDNFSAVVQFSIPLPLFNRNQGNVLKARHSLERARAGQRIVEVDIYTALTKSYQQLLMIHQELKTIEEELLVTSQRVYDDTRTAYEEGKASYLEVIDAQRMLFDARLRQNQTQASYHLIAIDVEALIGKSLTGF